VAEQIACREGGCSSWIISFYGAALLVSESLTDIAEHALAASGQAVDAAWQSSSECLQATVRGQHQEQLQKWAADRCCGGGSDPFLSANRLPTSVKRSLDLDGAKLSKKQAAGLAAAMIVPGAMTIGLGGIGAAMLVKSARDRTKLGGYPSAEAARGGDKWQSVQADCFRHAQQLLRRKAFPIEVHYQTVPNQGKKPKAIRVSLYSVGDMLCAMPIGGASMATSTGGQSSCELAPGQRSALMPVSSADTFRLRVYKPGKLLDEVLHDGVEVRRGDRLIIEPCPSGHEVRCFSDTASMQQRASTAWEGVDTAASTWNLGQLSRVPVPIGQEHLRSTKRSNSGLST